MTSKTILINPVTRIEGHAKITIHVDAKGNVDDARFHVVEFRGFERFIQGRPYWEVPVLVQRLCGICPVSHHLAAAKASLLAYEADLALAQRELADAQLCAPTNGVIRNRILEPGDMASPIKPVLTLAITDPLWVRAYLSEADLGKVWPGMAATVSTDSFPHRRYEGWVGYISPTAEFTPKTVQTPDVRTSLVYQVRVYVHNPRNELRLGMPATVRIDLRQARRPHGGDAGDGNAGAAASMPAEQP